MDGARPVAIRSTEAQLGSTTRGVQQAQTLAKKIMQSSGYGPTLHNACAATLSEFVNLAGINVPVTLGAGNLARRIAARGWGQITVGNQHAGDVAVATNNVHIFLVVQAINKNAMIIADNQAPGPHRRNASGDPQLNRSPVAYFLRAAGAAAPPVPAETEVQLSEFRRIRNYSHRRTKIPAISKSLSTMREKRRSRSFLTLSI